MDEIKNSDIFRYRDLDKSVVEPSDTVDISSPVDEDQLTIFDFAVTDAGVKSFSEINTNAKTQQELYEAYLKAFGSGKKQEQAQSDMQQLTMDQIFGTEAGNAATKPDEITHDSPVDGKGKKPLSKDEFVQKIKEYSGKAISVPKILVQTTSEVKFNRFEVKRNIPDFEVAMAKIERFDAINQQLLTAVDAQILEVDDALNTLACMLLDSISELSYEDADFIIDVVDQYLAQFDGNEEDKRKIVRRYASLIVSDIRKQIFEHTERKTEDIHIVQKDLILFRKFVKNVKKDGRVRFDKPFTDKANIKKYLFTGYKKAYYTENAFDSDTERLFSIILEEDPDVIRWIKPPLNQLGLFWQAGQQYNPDFLVETTNRKFMVEIKASHTGSADKEGSLGGLVELGNNSKLISLMKDAFQEALLCTNDPECMNNAPAGNNLNGAACHSCCMISETACENGNRMLDRGLVVPIALREQESFFRELVCELCQLEM